MKKIFYLVFFVTFLKICYCEKLKCNVTYNPQCNVDCSYMNFDNLPQQFEKFNVHYLTLDHNQLNSTVNFKNWTTLRWLDVSFNKIVNLTKNMFNELESLRFLNISYNNIENFEENVFQSVKYLEFLDLSGNPLMWTHKPSPVNILTPLLSNNLKKLFISSSRIENLPQDMFHETHELQYLDLSQNNLTKLPFFPKKLFYIDISNNSIQTLEIENFENATNLKDLLAENNSELYEIDNDLFEHMKSLRKISFKGCGKLENLPPNLLFFNKKLEYVSFDGCNLRTLSITFKNLFLKLKYLNLDHNPWNCNSTIKWFSKIGSPSNTSEDFRCGPPVNMTVLEFFSPDLEQAILRKILAVLLLIILVLFGLAIYISFNVETKNRRDLPYVPLEQKHPLGQSVYSTTVF